MTRDVSRTTAGRHSGLVRTATVLASICIAAAAAPTVGEAQEADIPDQNLRAAIEDALGKDSGAAITAAEMESLTVLWAERDGIEDLTGLELATGLTDLRLTFNDIVDVSPLSGLTSLDSLRLSGNVISDVSPLSGLTSLDSLRLSDNGISDVSPLSGLTSLGSLWLSGNVISDVSPLSGLTSLDSLRLSDNGMWDVSPLSGLTSLDNLDLSDNGISDVSPLSGLTSMDSLHLSGNVISDLSPLSGMRSLNWLYLSDNVISDVSPLSRVTSLTVLYLSDNVISDVSPLSRLTSLTVLDLSVNQISDMSPLSGLFFLTVLDLSDNVISEVPPLWGLFLLIVLDLSDNVISDVPPLSGLILLKLYLSDNVISDVSPLSDLRLLTHLDLSNNGIADLSPLEELERLKSLNAVANAIVDVGPVSRLPNLRSVYLGGNAVVDVMPLAGEPESLRGVSLWRNPLGANSLDVHVPGLRQRGVGVTGGGWRVPFFPSPGGFRQGFVRVVSSVGGGSASEEDASNRAWVYASGQDTTPARLLLGARKARHFNSDDLVAGNRRKGLRSTIGSGAGDSLDVYASADIDVLSYIRTSDGFVTSMHDTVPWLPPDDARLDVLGGRTFVESGSGAAGGHFVPVFNPASNPDQRSTLRLVNGGGGDVEVAVHAVDDHGVSVGPVLLTLAAHAAKTLTAEELESGAAPGLSGSLGDGEGKWRLVVSANAGIEVMNLMSSPTGHLTNLSTPSDGGLTVALFPAASHPTQQGFVRVANLSATTGTAQVRGYDDAGRAYGPLALQLPAGRTVHFNSNDWEYGGTDKGLEGAAGSGAAAWRLEFESALDIVVSAYVRTSDGFLTSMHDLVDRDSCAAEEVEGGRIAARSSRLFASRACRDELRVPLFNPASNTSQVSSLRLVNRGSSDAAVIVFGVDDEGAERGPASLSLPAGAARTLTSQELESGDGDGLAGALGDGTGKWELRVVVEGEAASDVMVMSLLESPTGHLTNLSTWPDGELRLR